MAPFQLRAPLTHPPQRRGNKRPKRHRVRVPAKGVQQVAFTAGDIVSEFSGPTGKAVWRVGKGAAEGIEEIGEHGTTGGLLRVVVKESLSSLIENLPLVGRPVTKVTTFLAQSNARIGQAVGNVLKDEIKGGVIEELLKTGVVNKTLEAVEQRSK